MIFDSFSEAQAALLTGAFVLSVILGVVVNKTNFCTMGAVSDMVNMGDFNRMRAWFLAIAVATLGVSLLEYAGLANLDASFPPYRASSLIILENILGGLLFGIGMTLASGCGNKTLVRIGGGNLKSIVVFAVIAIIAYYMTNPLPDSDQTLYSLLFYRWTQPATISLDRSQDIGTLLAGGESSTVRLIAGIVMALLLLAMVFRSAEFRHSRDNILSGIVIGLVIIAAWWLSSNILIHLDDGDYSLADYYQEWDMLADSDEGKPLTGRTLNPQSFTFINPMGQTFGYVKQGFHPGLLTFGLVSVAGVILGSLLWSLLSRSFRLEWFASLKDFATHFIGAVLMGFGGVLALGCTIGQGIAGASTLALGSFLALGAIILGSALTMRIQYYRLVYEDEAGFVSALLSALVDFRLLPAALRKLDAL